MIFIQATRESIVQVGDKTRIDVSKTFVSPDEAAITLIEIEPEDSNGYIDVTDSSRLDWVYRTSGDKTITVRVTTDGAPVTETYSLSALTQAEDRLFSSDQDILYSEVDLYKYLPDGRSSFLNIHRIAQENILDDLDQGGYTGTSGQRLTKNDIYDIQEVKEWSKYMTLSLIFRSVQTEADDFFASKADKYNELALKASKRVRIRLDVNQDSVPDYELRIMSGRIVRR